MQAIREERNDGVLVLAIAYPPVNALATPVRKALHASLRAAADDPAIDAVVIAGDERIFSGGADLLEFAAGTAMDAPSLHGDILPLIASMPKPVVAAVCGGALGGGLELALGCHARVFGAGARVGLPETTLGLMPGAGGTQTLPRAVGVARAAAAIAAGDVDPIDAYADTKLADAIVPVEHVRETAIMLARERARRGAPFGTLSPAPIDDVDAMRDLQHFRAGLASNPFTLPGVLRAVEAVALVSSCTVAEGMRREHALFAPLLDSAESRALRYVFVAERRAVRDPRFGTMEARLGARLQAGLQTAVATMVRTGTAPKAIAAALVAYGWPAAVGLSALPALSAPAAANDADAIVEPLVAALAHTGRRAVEEGVAACAADIDVVIIRTCGFPRFRGGPMFQADRDDASRAAA